MITTIRAGSADFVLDTGPVCATLAAMNTNGSNGSAHPGDADNTRARSAGTPPASKSPNVMGDLLAKSKVANATPCPNCKTYLPTGGVVCTHCGFNSATGKASSTRVVEIKKKESGRGAWPFGRK